MRRRSAGAFAVWLKRSGVRWQGLEIEHTPSDGARVLTSQPFETGDALAIIPKTTVLSIKNAFASALFDALIEWHGALAEQCLTLAVAHERRRGTASPWYGYFCGCTNAFEPLPYLWEEPELCKLLSGTGLDSDARARRLELREEYSTFMAALDSIISSSSESILCSTADAKAAASPVFSGDMFFSFARAPSTDRHLLHVLANNTKQKHKNNIISSSA